MGASSRILAFHCLRLDVPDLKRAKKFPVVSPSRVLPPPYFYYGISPELRSARLSVILLSAIRAKALARGCRDCDAPGRWRATGRHCASVAQNYAASESVATLETPPCRFGRERGEAGDPKPMSGAASPRRRRRPGKFAPAVCAGGAEQPVARRALTPRRSTANGANMRTIASSCLAAVENDR
jgi:hypothetical protein